MFCFEIEMKEVGGLYLDRVSGTNIISLDFIPPMSSVPVKSHSMSQPDGPDAVEPEPSTRKRRHNSMEPHLVPGVALVELNGVPSDNFSAPIMSPSTVSTSGQPGPSEESNDRTSKDYYFDSYSHHAIRKLFIKVVVRSSKMVGVSI